MDTAFLYLTHAGIVLLVFTISHAFLGLILWMNKLILAKIAKLRGLERFHRMIFMHNRKTLKEYEDVIHSFIDSLEEHKPKVVNVRKEKEQDDKIVCTFLDGTKVEFR